MNNLVSQQTTKFISRKTRKKRWMSLITALSCIVVFCTTYALILPAITMERDAFCGLKEHEHTEECYASVKVCPYGFEDDQAGAPVLICGKEEGDMPADALICGQEEYVHEHTDECYDISREFTCTKQEHTHTDDCYELQPVLTCTVTEHTHTDECYTTVHELTCTEQTHTHTDECYDEGGSLICTLSEHEHTDDCYQDTTTLTCETEEHTHGDDCYTEQPVLICAEEEHAHGDDCYTETRTLICTETGHKHDASCYAEGTVGHEHSDECYHTHTADCFEKQVVCETPEHQHVLQCYSNPERTESRDHWEKSIDAKLSGNWAKDLIAVAKTQKNYKESDENYLVPEGTEILKGYTRYGDWYGSPYADWNTLFAAFCLNYAGIGSDVFPIAQDANEWVTNLRLANMFAEAGSEPAEGDLVFFDYDQDGTADGVGIITDLSTKNAKISTLEGDINDEVSDESYYLSNEIIFGFGKLPVNPDGPAPELDSEPESELESEPDSEPESEPESELESEPDSEPDSNPDHTVTSLETTTEDGVTVTVTGNLPEGSVITLTKVPEETLEALLDQIGHEVPLFAYDITITDGDGNIWQPDELGAHVALTGLSVPQGSVEVAHVSEEGGIEYIDADSSESGIEFDAPGFSIYIGYTVEFSYDGSWFSITGESCITLSEIFSRLNIPVSVTELESVVFSDPTLISVEKFGDDWLLTSLAPFTTEEKLIITHKDGTENIIFVTDDQSGLVPSQYSTTVNVSLAWPDEGDTSPVTVTLYNNNVSTGQTRTLNSSNNWSASFTGLPAGNYSIVYSAPEGYAFSLSNSGQNKNGWYAADSLTGGDTFLIIQTVNRNQYAVRNNSGSTLGRTSVTINGDGSVTDLTTAMQWYYDGIYLQNRSTGNYLNITSNAASAGTSRHYILYNNNHIYRQRDNGNIYYLRRYSSGGMSGYTGTNDADEATAFTIYKYISESIINFDIAAEKTMEEKAPDHRKYIDAFRDNKENPDTDLDNKARAGQVTDDIYDLYRLYLEVGPENLHKPVDVLFIIDSSTSMSGFDGFDAFDINGNLSWRCWALDTLLNGEAEGATAPGESVTQNANQHQTTLYPNGMLSKIAAMNPLNRIAVARFSGTSEILMQWTPSAEISAVTYSNVANTNYVAGLQAALSLLEQVKNDGRKKLMIFISDGLPTYYYPSLNSTTTQGSGSEGTDEYNHTWDVIDEFYAHETIAPMIADDSLEIVTFGVGDWDSSLLAHLATAKTTYSSTDFQAILQKIDYSLTEGIGHYSDLKVTDTLSSYVDFYSNDLDFIIKRIEIDDDGNELTSIPLYENGELKTNGRKYIKENGVNINFVSKQVTVDFLDSYEEEGNVIFQISFNVKTKPEAYTQYAANLEQSTRGGYDGMAGDPGTDYITNATSSDKPGFYSNSSATLDYTQSLAFSEPISGTIQFDKPVVQVDLETPVTPPSETVFAHNKTIDFLGDGGTNPDTTLRGQDYYRLYLDMVGKQEPIDLLFVVDGSSSMNKNDMTIGDLEEQDRDDAITTFINGTLNSSASNANGFLAYFLGLNREHKVAVVQFHGQGSIGRDSTTWVSTSTVPYTTDSRVILNWTDQSSFTNRTFADCSVLGSGYGTDYEAGFKLATAMFSDDAVRTDGHRKIMIFLSDGVPTYFLIDNNDVGTVCNSYTIRSRDVGYRWGTGSYDNANNYSYIKGPSKRAFDDFMAANPNVIVYSIGVSADINATSSSGSQSPDVLKYMAEKGGGEFLSVSSSMDELESEIQALFYPKNVVITDNLSRYVRYYGAQPDVKVTMTNQDSGAETVLYANGRVTSAGRGILTNVIYTPGDTSNTPYDSTGTIKAVFDEDYWFRPDYTYTLSFNVETTQTAHDRYESRGYNATGHTGTDYGTNTTSSGQPGFYSNDSATVSYAISDGNFTEDYRMPVIQVPARDTCDLSIQKTVPGVTSSAAFPFELIVCDSTGTPVDLTSYTRPNGVTLQSKDGVACVLAFSLAHGEGILLEDLPEDAKLTLIETAHDGYSVTMTVGSMGSFSGDSQSFDLSDDLSVTVTNAMGTELPATGGPGTLWFTLGGLLLIAGACVYAILTRHERERRLI